MQPIIIAIWVIHILIVVSLVIENLRKWSLYSRRWVTLMATVIAIDVRQDWKYSDRLIRDDWSDGWVPERTWQSYYAVTAQWTDPQIQHSYRFYGQCWVKETTRPVIETTIPVIMHPRDPSRYVINFKPEGLKEIR